MKEEGKERIEGKKEERRRKKDCGRHSEEKMKNRIKRRNGIN